MNLSLFSDFITLIYPRLCYACGNNLMRGEKGICTYCQFHLPRTFFHNDAYNPVFRTFWGRVNIEMAASYVYFNKGGHVQALLHKLKYSGIKEIGVFIGKIYGVELQQSVYFNDVEMIIPVPLHKRKLKKRGYNQSEMFATGLCEGMRAGLNTKSLFRKEASETQTKKSRYQRWENVENIFTVRKQEDLAGKHLLLVDDVITTGATIEACAEVLLKVPGVKLSVCAIAYAI